MKIAPRPFPRSEVEKLVAFLPFFKEHNTFEFRKWVESKLGNKKFNKKEFLNRKEELKVHVQREFWFEISSFYGKNFIILNEGD